MRNHFLFKYDKANPQNECQGNLTNIIPSKQNYNLGINNYKCVNLNENRQGNVPKIQFSQKETKKIFEEINASKKKLSLLQINKQVKLYIKSNLNWNKDKILGGGACCSKQEINETNFNTIKTVEESPNENDQNKEFEKEFKKWTHQETMLQSLEKDGQLKVQRGLLQQCIIDQILQTDGQINEYQLEIQHIFEMYLMLEVTRISNKPENMQEQFENILNDVKSIESSVEDYPIMELVYYIEILINLNKINYKFDESQQKELIKIKELVSRILKTNKNQDFSDIVSRANSIKQNIHIFDNQKELFPLKYQIEIWLRKIDQFGDKFCMISREEEILFYVKYFFEINKLENQQNQLVLTLIRINYLLEKFLKEKSKKSDKIQNYQQFSQNLIKANIEEFLNELMQKQELFNNKIFLIFSVEDQNYRYITLSILLTINSIFTIASQTIKNQEYLLHFLCNKYLTEQELAIRVIFEKSNEFVQYFNENIKMESFKEKMIQFDKQRKQKLLPHVKSLGEHERSINSFDDIIKLISDNAILKWERDIKKRQKQNIAQKDDVLLEVKDLYINQMITYLNGNSIFQRVKINNQVNEETLQQNAILDILNIFLNPDYSYRKKLLNNQIQENDNENTFKQQSNQCQILGILAEGGTGKSMFMKKIEILLIEKLKKLTSASETGNYLPLLIKCNSLDPKNPSLEEYLKQQGINEDMIQSLKQNERNKLILLDGYDEYAGDYFAIYSTLKINEWKNTKIIVATRKEKLTEKDACSYFSKQNEQGQRDEMSYTLVKLEEFTQKDIHEYANRYFKQERKTDQTQEIQKDLNNLRDCLTNTELEKLLRLPINLYLFTRMLINLNDKEIQNLKTKVSDQIGIQEIFFSDQFEREAQTFIDSHIHSLDLKKDQKFRTQIQNCYFEYFQTVAMTMFLNRGVKKGNYLQVERQNVNFNIPQAVTQNLQEQSLVNSLSDKIKNYVNSKIITRVKSEQEQKMHQNAEKQQQYIEFKHKSLYEYFTARAMKNDFDIHEENINKLSIEELQQFKINQKSIMNIGQNQSEQQILIKLFKLLKNEIESEEFRQNYHENQIEKNNRYIQYLKRSQIQANTEISKIDVGASNLISALFVSKFSFSKLHLTLCSFSKAYICIHKSNEIKFDRCNLQHAYLQNSCINFDSCNTQSASIDAFQKVFDTADIYSFNKAFCDSNNTLYSVSKSGYVNVFKMANQGFNLQQSKQLSQSTLCDIQFINDSQLLVSSEYTLFLINSNNLEIQQNHKFTQSISNVTIIEDNIVVAFKNESIFKGSFKNGFQKLSIFGNGSAYNKINQILVTYQKQSFSVWNIQKNFELIKTINEHKSFICSIAFSSDGKYLATGSRDKTCKIWSIDKGFELINTIEGHNDYVSSVSFSSEGNYLATGSYDNTCKIWNVKKNFELLNTIQEHTDKISYVTFSGKYLTTGSESNACKIWNTEKNFELFYTNLAHTKRINSVAFSADGKYFATSSGDMTCKIWNAEKSFEIINTIKGHTGSINSIAFSMDGKYLASGSDDKTCKIWNVKKDFELIKTIQSHSVSLSSVAFSANGKYLATGSKDSSEQNCKIWNVEKDFELIHTIKGPTIFVTFSGNGKYLAICSYSTCKIMNVEQDFELIKKIKEHDNDINSAAFSRDGKYLATGSDDKTYKVWSVEKDFEIINTVQAHNENIISVAFSSDGKYLASGSSDNTCKLWDLEKGFGLINTIQGHTDYVNSVAFSANKNYLATGSSDVSCKIWNVEQGFELINTIQGHSNKINSVAFSADGKCVATGSSDNTFKIWNAEKGFEVIHTIQAHNECIRSIQFSANGKYLATCSEDNTCKIWNVQNGFELLNIIEEHTRSVISVGFSADSRFLATGSEDGTCKIWNTGKGFELIKTIFYPNYISSVSFSPDGKYLATCSCDMTISLWNIDKDYVLLNTLEGHSHFVNTVLFSPDGNYLLSGSLDTTFKIWNVKKGFELINTIKEHTHSINSFSFSVDGMYLATGCGDQTCKIWNIKKNFELVNTIYAHTQWISSVAFSTDGKSLVTGSDDNTCKIWNMNKDLQVIDNLYVL